MLELREQQALFPHEKQWLLAKVCAIINSGSYVITNT